MPVTFRLGVPFQIQILASVQFASGAGSGPSGQDYGAGAEVRLFEADGVTPVLIGEVPEPRMTLLTAAGLLAMLFRAIRVRQ
jgi:hypothetical protein